MLRSKPVEVAQIYAKATGLAPEVNGHVIKRYTLLSFARPSCGRRGALDPQPQHVLLARLRRTWPAPSGPERGRHEISGG